MGDKIGGPPYGHLVSQGPPPIGNTLYQRPIGYRRQASVPVNYTHPPVSNPFGQGIMAPAEATRPPVATPNVQPSVSVPCANQRPPPIQSVDVFRPPSAGILLTDPFAFTQPTYEQKQSVDQQQQQRQVAPFSSQPLSTLGIPVSNSQSGHFEVSSVQGDHAPSEGLFVQSNSYAVSNSQSGHFEVNSVQGDHAPPEGLFVQSNSYAAYGAENDPEQILSQTNAFATAELSDSKLASYFSGFGPMSPGQGKDFFNKPPGSATVSFCQAGNQPVQPPALSSSGQATMQGHTGSELDGMVGKPSQNHEQQQFDPLGSASGHMVDGDQWPNSVPHSDTKKQDVRDSQITQYSDSEIVDRDQISLVDPGGSILPVTAQSSVTIGAQTTDCGIQQSRQEKAMGLIPNQLDQLSDQFAAHSIAHHPSFPQQLSEDNLGYQEPIPASRSADTRVPPSSSTSLPSVSQVQPDDKSLPSDRTVPSPSQPTAPSGPMPHNRAFSEQRLVTGPYPTYFPNISPPGEQVDAVSGHQSKPNDQQSVQSQMPSGIEDSQSYLSMLHLSAPGHTQNIVTQRPPSTSSGTSDSDLPTSTPLGIEHEQRHSMSLPVSETRLASHASQSYVNHPAVQEALPHSLEQSLPAHVQELPVLPPQDESKSLSNSSVPPSAFPPTNAQVVSTFPVGTYEVDAFASSQPVVSPVLQTEGQYQSITAVPSSSTPNAVFPAQPSVQEEQPLVSHLPVMTSTNETTAFSPFQQPGTNTVHSLFSETLTNKGGTNTNQVLPSAVIGHPPVWATGHSTLATLQQPSSSHPAVATSVTRQAIMSVTQSSLEQQSQQLPVVTNSDIYAQEMVQPNSMASRVSSSSSATQEPGTQPSAPSGEFAFQPSLINQHKTQPVSTLVSGISHSLQPLHYAVSEGSNSLNQQQLQTEPPAPTRAPLQTHPRTAIISTIDPSQQSLQPTLSGIGAIPSQQVTYPEIVRPGVRAQDTVYSGREAQPLLTLVPQTLPVRQDTHQGEMSQPSTPSVRDLHMGHDHHPEMHPNVGHTFFSNRSHPSAFHEPERLPFHVPPHWPQGYSQYSDNYLPGRGVRRPYDGYRGYRNELYDEYPDNYYEDDYYYMQKQYGRYNPYSTDKHYHSYSRLPDEEPRWRDYHGYSGYPDHYRYQTGGQHEYSSQYYGARDHYHDNYHGEYENKSTVDTDYQADLSSIHGGDDKFGLEGMGVDYQDTTHYVDYDGHQEYDQSQHYKGSFLDPGTSGFYSGDAWQPVQKTPSPPPRATPAKFNRPHVIARFSVQGHLVTVLPQLLASDKPSPVEISEIHAEASQKDVTEIASFPGPLLRDETPKVEVVAFASHKATMCRKAAEVADNPLERESLLSSALLWDYLILLCRQNGAVDGNDASDLLMRQSELPLGQQQQSQSCNLYAAETQYRNLLLSGRKKQALETAVRGQLWGHAFALAWRMDSRVQNSVMTRFVESCRSSDPLQTYYLMQSGKQPVAVRGTMDPSWGDWKPHVAMMMANKSSDDDLRNVMAVSANLAKRDMCGSHLCYLLAGGRISHPSESRCKAALLGTDHTLPLTEYATIEAIQRTEVYEYACSLNDINFCCPALQCFKLLYAYSLIDCGLATKALQYCEAISLAVHFVPGKFSSSFVSQLYELGCRLHSCDTHSRTMYHDGLPEWLLSLENILSQREDHTIKTAEPTPSPLPPAAIVGERPTTMEGYFPTDNLNYQDMPQSTQSAMYMYNQQLGTSLQSGIDHQLFNGSSRSSLAGSRTDLLLVGREHEQPYQFQGYDNGGNVANYTPLTMQVPTSSAVGSQEMEAPSTQSGVVGYMPSQYSWDGIPSGDSGPPPPPNVSGMSYALETNAQSNTQSDTGTEIKSNQQPWEQTSARPAQDNDVSEDKTDKKKPKESKPSHESTWFIGRLWKKIKPNNNQMNLPDDKKKSIVWDEQLKQWVDSEGNEEETSGPAAPPTDFQLKSQGLTSVPGQRDAIGGDDHMGTSLPGAEQDGPAMNKPSVNAYSRIGSGPRGRLGIRTKYVDVLNPAGSGDSSTQSSVVPPPAVPGFTNPMPNPMPNQQFGGTVFIPELSGGNTSNTFTQQQSDVVDQVQSSEGQMPYANIGSVCSGHSSGSQMPLMFGTSSSNGQEQTRIPTPDRMSTASEVSEFSMEVRQHMGYMGSTEQSSDQTIGQIPMYSSSGPPPRSGLYPQPQRGLGRLKGARPQYGGAGMPSKPPTTT